MRISSASGFRPGLSLALFALAGSYAAPALSQSHSQGVSVGARVIALNQCGFDAEARSQCSSSSMRPAMWWSPASAPALRHAKRSSLSMKINPIRASVNFTGTVSASPGEPVVLTIAP